MRVVNVPRRLTSFHSLSPLGLGPRLLLRSSPPERGATADLKTPQFLKEKYFRGLDALRAGKGGGGLLAYSHILKSRILDRIKHNTSS